MYHRLGLVPRQLCLYNRRRDSAGSAITQRCRAVPYATRELSLTTTCRYASSASTGQSPWRCLDMLADGRAARRVLEQAAEGASRLLPSTNRNFLSGPQVQQLSCFFFSLCQIPSRHCATRSQYARAVYPSSYYVHAAARHASGKALSTPSTSRRVPHPNTGSCWTTSSILPQHVQYGTRCHHTRP